MGPNSDLDALLNEAGISHAGLALRINQAGQSAGRTHRYDHTSVGRWLRGQRPRGRVPEVICDILAHRLQRRVTLDDIGMGAPASERPPGGPLTQAIDRATAMWQQRRDLDTTPAIAGAGAIAPVWEWENPPEDRDVAREGSPRVGRGEITVLGSARSHYEQIYRRAGGITTRARVVGFLGTEVAPLLRGSYSDATGRVLFRAAGGVVAVAGICAYDADAQGIAQRYFHQALRLAKASGDRAFGGYVIALLVNQSIFRREYRQAVAFAEAALRTAGPHISPALATDLHAMQAKAFARMGEQGAAHRCMELAEAASGRIRRADEPAETGYVQPGLVEAQLAETLMSLGDLSPARDYAQEAVDVQSHPRGRVHRLATLTNVDLRAGEIDRAAASALEMVDQAQGQESRRLWERLASVRKNLAAAGTAATEEAIERIDATLLVPF